MKKLVFILLYLKMTSIHKKKKVVLKMVGEINTIYCPDSVISGSLITKEKRHEQFGAVAGGAGSQKPEAFQRSNIVEGTGIECSKTNIRINLRTNILVKITRPNTQADGFDYSENFDGVQTLGKFKVYINLKCVVGRGGNQTRSLREVYWFIEGQFKVLATTTEPVYFANILDGDESHSQMNKFEYLRSFPEFAEISSHVYIGDLKGYFQWFMSKVQ